MSNWSLSKLLENLHSDIQSKLQVSRQSFNHPGAKGDASESVWLELLNEYLPKRYEATSGFVVDSLGKFSQQIDVIVFDRQYSPFIFKFQGQVIIPAESVYAVFEAKQDMNSTFIEYAQSKVESVRALHRTSIPIPHAGGVYPAKPLIPIIGGILTLDSVWAPPMGDTLLTHLKKGTGLRMLDLGCVASHGILYFDRGKNAYDVHTENKPATALLFKLISELQFSGTVPMIDIQAYGQWLLK